eukprot:SAG11_NODE_13414_length_656_cov_0.877917_2_plen_98_part_01
MFDIATQGFHGTHVEHHHVERGAIETGHPELGFELRRQADARCPVAESCGEELEVLVQNWDLQVADGAPPRWCDCSHRSHKSRRGSGCRCRSSKKSTN